MRLERQLLALSSLALLIIITTQGAVLAEQIVVQGESYTDFYDFMGNAITLYSPTILQGPDFMEEWVEFSMPVSIYGTYDFSMLCWGLSGVSYSMIVYFIPDSGGDIQSTTTTFVGAGCFT